MLDRIFNVVILAAGQGKRMCSSVPKVLHSIGGKFILQHVIDIALEIGPNNIYIVYSEDYTVDLFMKNLDEQQKECITWVLQSPVCGTGHAVQEICRFLDDDVDILILYGDVPLLSLCTLYRLFHAKPLGGISLLTANFKDSSGYGRILRNKEGQVIDIIEDSDMTEEHVNIHEANTGIMIVTSNDLKRWVFCITDNNVSHEFYLTDIINIAWNEGRIINTILPNNSNEVEGINNRLQLAKVERIYQKLQAERLLLSGVMLSDPNRFDLRGKLKHGKDVFIDVNVIIEGIVYLGNRVCIGTGCVLKNSIIYDDVVIYPYSYINGAKLYSRSVIGPFAHVRCDTEIGEEVSVGNFVELKNTKLGSGSKVNHISYMGDADVGVMVNVGAGTVVCNYDGLNKYKTIIGDNVFIGSDSQLVAPVVIGSGAKIGAGTTVTRDVAPGEIIISRVRQFPINSWTRLIKKK